MLTQGLKLDLKHDSDLKLDRNMGLNSDLELK